MSRRTLILMCGLPRSGKTTKAREFGHPVVSPDEVRLALHGQRYARDAEPMVWAIVRVMVKALFGAGHSTVVLDGCNNTRARRDEWKSTDWTTAISYVPATAAECSQRATAEGRDDIVPVIARMDATHEPPQPGEILLGPFVRPASVKQGEAWKQLRPIETDGEES